MPFFSVIIPTYNRADLILDSLESLRQQSFHDFEVIIVDDGSTDATETRIKKYFADKNLSNWHYSYIPNSERGAARNHGISCAKGRFITFLDSDDVLYEDHLERAHQKLSTNTEIKLLHNAYEIGSGKDKRPVIYKKHVRLNKQLLKGNLFSCFGVFTARELLREKRFSESRKLSGSEDWLLWLQLSVADEFYFQEKITGCLREHEHRSVLNVSEQQLVERATLIKEALEKDRSFVEKYGASAIRRIYAHMLSYGALHLALSKNRKASLLLLLKAIARNPPEIFTKRFLAVLKHLI